MIATNVATVSPLLAAIALLIRSRWAVHLYALSFAAIVVTSAWDISQGTALMLKSPDWLLLNCVTACLAIAQLAYAAAMRGRGVLR